MTMWRAEEALIAECMQARGFPYVPVPVDTEPEQNMAFERVAPGDIDAARALGYGIAQAIAQGEQPKTGTDPNAAWVEGLPPEQRSAYFEALQGPAISPSDPSVRERVVSLPIPGGGAVSWYRDSCLAEARSQLYGDDYEDNELGFGRRELQRELASRIQREPAVAGAADRWRGCMQRRGHQAEHSGEIQKALARDYRAGKLTLEQLREREIAAATADAECFAEAGVGAARRAAQESVEPKLVAEKQARLAKLKSAQLDALARAEALVAEHEPAE